MSKGRFTTAVAAAIFAVLALAFFEVSPAMASTICVPAFSPACPHTGNNFEMASLDDAIKQNGADGISDKVIVAAGTLTNFDAFDTAGTDALEIVGAGVDQTAITTSAIGDSTVLNIAGGSRDVTLSGLTVVIPSSFTDNAGEGIDIGHATLKDMDIESQNPGSDGVPNIQKGATFSNVSMFGTGTGSFDIGISQSGVAYNPLAIDRSTIEDAKIGILANHFTVALDLTRSKVLNSKTNAVKLAQGSDGTIENSILQAGSASAVLLTDNQSNGGIVDIRNSTIIPGTSPGNYAVATETNASAMTVGSAQMTVSDSILSGFTNTYYRSDPDFVNTGPANLTISHSDFNPNGLSTGKGILDLGDSNINADPKFVSATDFHLTKGSPAIDAASSSGGPLVDLDGNLRPVDGNGDGSAVVDMGAYEYQPVADPPTCATDPSLCPNPPPDTTAPKISKVKFNAPKGKKKGSLKLTLSEAAKVKATFKPVPKKGKKRKTLKLSKSGKAGANTFSIKKNKLKPGKYKLTIVAIDGAGNKSKTVRRKVKVSVIRH